MQEGEQVTREVLAGKETTQAFENNQKRMFSPLAGCILKNTEQYQETHTYSLPHKHTSATLGVDSCTEKEETAS